MAGSLLAQEWGWKNRVWEWGAADGYGCSARWTFIIPWQPSHLQLPLSVGGALLPGILFSGLAVSASAYSWLWFLTLHPSGHFYPVYTLPEMRWNPPSTDGPCCSPQWYVFSSVSFFKFNFIIGVYFFYNVMFVSAIQQSESASCEHIWPPSGASLPPIPCPHPTSLGHQRALNQAPCTVPFSNFGGVSRGEDKYMSLVCCTAKGSPE